MAFDSGLANRLRAALDGQAGLTEKNMFGGLAFLLRGNMCCGVYGEDMIVRVRPDRHEKLLSKPGAKPFVMGGRRGSKGWLMVEDEGLRGDALDGWIEEGVTFALSLPPK